MQESAAVYQITPEQIKKIVTIAAKEAVKVYREEQQKAEKEQAERCDKGRNARRILEGYRRVKASLQESEALTAEERSEYRWSFLRDLMGNRFEDEGRTERIIQNEEKRRRENLYCVQCVEEAADRYRRECEDSGKEEIMRRYEIMYLRYMDAKEHTPRQIAVEKHISEASVYRDLTAACDAMADYMLGA